MADRVNYVQTVARTLRTRIRALDELVSKQLAEVMHHAEFQRLEGSWRGLHYLVSSTETSDFLRIRLLNVSQDELRRDLERGAELNQTEVFKKVCSDEFNVPGGTPYGILIGDYEFTNTSADLSLLAKLSQIAAAAHCPFLSAASPQQFGMGSWKELQDQRTLARIISDKPNVEWEAYRDSPDSRFVVLTLPRVLARFPYGANTHPIDEFDFEEMAPFLGDEPTSTVHDRLSWMNAAFVLGARITDAFAKSRCLRGCQGSNWSGPVEGLPTHRFGSVDGDSVTNCAAEVPINDRFGHVLRTRLPALQS
jgi:type VI secretion system protein ImpC